MGTSSSSAAADHGSSPNAEANHPYCWAISSPEVLDWKKQSPSDTGMAAVRDESVSLCAAGRSALRARLGRARVGR